MPNGLIEIVSPTVAQALMNESETTDFHLDGMGEDIAVIVLATCFVAMVFRDISPCFFLVHVPYPFDLVEDEFDRLETGIREQLRTLALAGG